MKLLVFAAAIFALAAFGCSGDELPPAATATPANTSAAGGQPDREAALAEVQARFPALLAAIAAVESEDAGAILESLRWKEFECTPDDHRGGIAPRCSELGVPLGTLVPMFHYELLETSYFTHGQMRERIGDYVLGRSPQLALVAAHPDGRWLISFMVDDTAGDGLRAMDFRAEAGGSAPLTSHRERFEASTPLDTLREEDRGSGAKWEIIFASPALLEWDAEDGP
jgi:predicted small lipoprotein YifL